ncbi:MAG: hypothetical protein AAFU73_05515 [Planctomycetota bacterium]
MSLFLSPCALVLLGAPPAPTIGLSAASQEDAQRAISSETNGTIGLTFFVPKYVEARSLVEYAQPLLRVRSVSTNDPRPRFVAMESVVGVQGTDEERVRFLEMLGALDAQLGDLEARRAREAPRRSTRALELRSLPVDAAATLARGLVPSVTVSAVEDLGVLVLEGAEADVERLVRALGDLDVPRPQVRLYAEVVAARDSNAPGQRADPAIADALAPMHPGKAFVSLGSAMVRGAVGGGSTVEIASTLLDPGLPEGTVRQLRLVAQPTGYDPRTTALHLEDCRIELEDRATGAAEPALRQGVTTSLDLRADEPTVVGSLGGAPLYVVLRFTAR